MNLIIKAMGLKNNQTVIDLGAGDGIVIFAAANYAMKRKLNTRFVAIDINPILFWIMQIRRLFHPNRKNIKIALTDMFKINNTYVNPLIDRQYNLTTYYLYISPWLIEKTVKIIKKIRGSKNIVSYFYKINSLKERMKLTGIHAVYKYDI